MLPIKAPRFFRTLHILAAMLPLCGLQLYGQRLDSRTPLSEAARAMAAKAKAARTANAALVLPPPTAVGTFVTFDVPGAINGTSPAGINNGGDTAGYYGDNVGSGFHGFIRAANGSFVTFDVPGAVNGTFPSSINNGGDTAGYYGDNVGSGFHGFIRAADGSFVTYDVPGAVNGVAASVINAKGEVAGVYFDANGFAHSFLREPNGALTTFDPPGAVTGSIPYSITPNGVILGVYFDANFNFFGFLRDTSGAFTEITGPGGQSGQIDGYIAFGAVLSINPGGEIAGTYFEPIAGNPFGGNFRVFLLSKDGEYTTFDAANYPPCCIFSSPSGINPRGTVTGSFNDGFNIYRGFLRTPDGTVSTFDAPGAGTGNFQGTVSIGITPGGVIAGFYAGPNDGNVFRRTHGFLFRPK